MDIDPRIAKGRSFGRGLLNKRDIANDVNPLANVCMFVVEALQEELYVQVHFHVTVLGV